MSVSCNQEDYCEENIKKVFEDAALTNMIIFLKNSFWQAISSDEVLPPEIRLAFKIDTVDMLKKAFEIAIKEFENDCD